MESTTNATENSWMGSHCPRVGPGPFLPPPGGVCITAAPLATMTTTVGVIAFEAVGMMIGLDPNESPLVDALVPVIRDFVAEAAVLGHGGPVPAEDIQEMMFDTEAIVMEWMDHPRGEHPPCSSHPLATAPIGFADLATQAVNCTLDGARKAEHGPTIGLVGAAFMTWIIGMAAAQTRGGITTTVEVKALLSDAFADLMAQVVAEMDR